MHDQEHPAYMAEHGGAEGAGGAEHHAEDPPIFRRIHSGFDSVERVLIYVVSGVLIGLAGVSVINTLVLVWDPIFKVHDYNKAISQGFDAAFLTIILLEVLHTVLSRSALVQQVQEFLVIGITSAVRHSLGIAADAGSTHPEVRSLCTTVTVNETQVRRMCSDAMVAVLDGTSQEIVIELAVNACAVVLLVGALWLVRQSTLREATMAR